MFFARRNFTKYKLNRKCHFAKKLSRNILKNVNSANFIFFEIFVQYFLRFFIRLRLIDHIPIQNLLQCWNYMDTSNIKLTNSGLSKLCLEGMVDFIV